MPGAENPSVKSAERTVRILEALADSPTRLSLAQLQERMGYPRSSLHALVRTLRELRWIEADETGSSFGVGPHALLSGTAYLDRDPALPYATHTLEDIRAEIGYTIHYARRDDAHIIYLASREARDTVRVVSRVGRRLPVHITALGQVLLSDLTESEVDALLPAELEPFTDNTITNRAELHAALDETRSRGWASEREHGTVGVACVAATVDYRIPATDAISCSMPAQLATSEELERVAAVICEHARSLASTLRRNGIRLHPLSEFHVCPGPADPVERGVGVEVGLAVLGDQGGGEDLGVVDGVVADRLALVEGEPAPGVAADPPDHAIPGRFDPQARLDEPGAVGGRHPGGQPAQVGHAGEPAADAQADDVDAEAVVVHAARALHGHLRQSIVGIGAVWGVGGDRSVGARLETHGVVRRRQDHPGHARAPRRLQRRDRALDVDVHYVVGGGLDAQPAQVDQGVHAAARLLHQPEIRHRADHDLLVGRGVRYGVKLRQFGRVGDVQEAKRSPGRDDPGPQQTGDSARGAGDQDALSRHADRP
jgi:DNA-binding IclR family transcriptional regulator